MNEIERHFTESLRQQYDRIKQEVGIMIHREQQRITLLLIAEAQNDPKIKMQYSSEDIIDAMNEARRKMDKELREPRMN